MKKTIPTSVIFKMLLKGSLVVLFVGCSSNQVSIGEQNADASAGGAGGRVDPPVSSAKVGGSSAVGGNKGWAGRVAGTLDTNAGGGSDSGGVSGASSGGTTGTSSSSKKIDGGVSDPALAAALCIATGGEVATQLCCANVGDFPNTCMVGACSCAPTSGRNVNVCSCPLGCFVPDVGCFSCIYGLDQTCNNDPNISAPHGKCLPNGQCSCSNGYRQLDNGQCE